MRCSRPPSPLRSRPSRRRPSQQSGAASLKLVSLYVRDRYSCIRPFPLELLTNERAAWKASASKHAKDGGCPAPVQARADRAEEAAVHPAALLQGAVGPNWSAHRAVDPSLRLPPTAPPRSSQTGRVLSVAGCLTTAGVLCVGFGAFISGNKVLAQNMMHGTTQKQAGSALRQLALRRLLSAPDHASGYPRLWPASANRPLGRLWSAISPSFRRRRARVAAQFATIAVMGAATKYSLDSDAAAAAEATKPAPAVPGPAVV